MLQNIAIYYVFATLAPQRHPKKSILAIPGPTMSATPHFGDKIGPNLGLYKQYLKPDDARKGYHEPTMSTKPSSKSRMMRAKAKKTPLCPVSLIAIELKGLAAPGEALKNILPREWRIALPASLMRVDQGPAHTSIVPENHVLR